MLRTQQGCICHESRCCRGLHGAAGCRAWWRVSACSAQSRAWARHWQWCSLLNVNDDQSVQRLVRLNIPDTWLANQTAPNGVIKIVCRSEIHKMAECFDQQATCGLTNHSEVNVVGAHQSQITKCGHPTLEIVFLCYASRLLWHRTDKFRYKKPAPINTIRWFSIYQWWPSCEFQFLVSSVLLTSADPDHITTMTMTTTTRG